VGVLPTLNEREGEAILMGVVLMEWQKGSAGI